MISIVNVYLALACFTITVLVQERDQHVTSSLHSLARPHSLINLALACFTITVLVQERDQHVTSSLHSLARPHSLINLALALTLIVQELCESPGGRPGLSVLTSLLVSVDVKLY